MLFDYFSLSEENKQKWKKSIVIAVIIGILYFFNIHNTVSDMINASGLIKITRLIQHKLNSIAILFITLFVSRIVASTVG
jgi:hypothetical protein